MITPLAIMVTVAIMLRWQGEGHEGLGGEEGIERGPQ